jgi:xylulokinase
VGYFLGIDVSTTATKALLMDADGSVVAVGRATYGVDTPRPLWSEQDPKLWWHATVEAIHGALSEAKIRGEDVVAVGLTGQMHGAVLLDAHGEVVRPAILWNDQRTQAQCDRIRALVGRQRLIATTGNDALTGFTAPKILWVRDHEPELYARTAQVLLPKDYVRYRLTGCFATDKADGSGTLLFDLAERDWSAELLELLELPPDWFPPSFEAIEVTGSVSSQATSQTGLVEGTPVVAGGGDQSVSAVGVGAVEAGVVAVSLGTSGVVFASTVEPMTDPAGRLQAFCHAVPATWHLMGVMLSAAGSLRWFRDTMAPERSYSELDALAAASPTGAHGLVFLPYLTGERTPHSDPTARGAFVGLTVRHGLGDLARAVMEGVGFGLRGSLELLTPLMPVHEIRVSGGGVASDVWIRILADVFGRPVRVAQTTESAAHGAAILAATGQGAFPTVQDACRAAVSIGPEVAPSPDAPHCNDVYGIYRSLYPQLRASFARLSGLDG